MLLRMPSAKHDILVQLVRMRPEIIPFLLLAAYVWVPCESVTLADSQLLADFAGCERLDGDETGGEGASTVRPRCADLVVLCGEGKNRYAVVCEVQTSRPSMRQLRRQHTYLALSADGHACRSILLVLTVSRAVAYGCYREHLPGHPGLVIIPVVVGPYNTPLPDDPWSGEFAAELAVLGVLNGNLDMSEQPVRKRVMEIVAAGSAPKDYCEFIWCVVPAAVRREVEREVTTKYHMPILDKTYKQGRADTVLDILAARQIAVPEDIERRIRACTNMERLNDWVAAAATANCLADVFPARSRSRRLVAVPRQARD